MIKRVGAVSLFLPLLPEIWAPPLGDKFLIFKNLLQRSSFLARKKHTKSYLKDSSRRLVAWFKNPFEDWYMGRRGVFRSGNFRHRCCLLALSLLLVASFPCDSVKILIWHVPRHFVYPLPWSKRTTAFFQRAAIPIQDLWFFFVPIRRIKRHHKLCFLKNF